MEILKDENRTARKKHNCDLCGGVIEISEEYRVQTNKYDGDIYNFKTHLHCEYLASHYDMYSECHEGLNADIFSDIMQGLFADEFKISEITKLLYDKVKRKN
jgi:hypothetical protein